MARLYIEGAHDWRLAKEVPAAFQRAKLKVESAPTAIRELRSLGWPLSEPASRYGISESDIGPDGPKSIDTTGRAMYAVRAVGGVAHQERLEDPSVYRRAVRDPINPEF